MLSFLKQKNKHITQLIKKYLRKYSFFIKIPLLNSMTHKTKNKSHNLILPNFVESKIKLHLLGHNKN